MGKVKVTKPTNSIKQWILNEPHVHPYQPGSEDFLKRHWGLEESGGAHFITL